MKNFLRKEVGRYLKTKYCKNDGMKWMIAKCWRKKIMNETFFYKKNIEWKIVWKNKLGQNVTK